MKKYTEKFYNDIMTTMGDVETKLYVLMRKVTKEDTVNINGSRLEVRQLGNGARGMFIDGVHVLSGDVFKTLDVLDALETMVENKDIW